MQMTNNNDTQTNMASINHPPKLTKRDRAALTTTTSHSDLADGSRRFTYFTHVSSDSPYHPSSFHVELIIPLGFPMGRPRVRFLTRIFHPYVDKAGKIDPNKCICISPQYQNTPATKRLRFTLGCKWSPHLGIEGVMNGVNNFLNMPASRDWAFLHLKHHYNEVGRSTPPNDATIQESFTYVENQPPTRDVMILKEQFHHPFPITVSRVLLTFFNFNIAHTITTFLDASISLRNTRTFILDAMCRPYI